MNKEKLNIRQFKLINGEEIVAHVMQKDPGSYVIERPLRVLSNFIGGFTFQRWFPFSSQKLFLKHGGPLELGVDIPFPAALTQTYLKKLGLLFLTLAQP